MRVLITGASGYLGRHLLASLPTDWQVWAGWHRQPVHPGPALTPLCLDIGQAEAVAAAVRAIRPDLILHTAIARQPVDFDAIIVRGSAHIAAAAAQGGARLIHLSSDIVFDGTAESYSEAALPCPDPLSGQPDPLNPHGRAKARAEALVRQLHPATVIVRTSLIYGFSPLDHSTTWLAEGLRDGKAVTLFTDQIRCPVFAPDLAASLVDLAGVPFSGVLHLVGPTPISRYDFGLLLCHHLGLDPTGIRAVPTPPDFVAPRQLVLTDGIARSLLRTRRRSPDECLLRK